MRERAPVPAKPEDGAGQDRQQRVNAAASFLHQKLPAADFQHVARARVQHAHHLQHAAGRAAHHTLHGCDELIVELAGQRHRQPQKQPRRQQRRTSARPPRLTAPASNSTRAATGLSPGEGSRMARARRTQARPARAKATSREPGSSCLKGGQRRSASARARGSSSGENS